MLFKLLNLVRSLALVFAFLTPPVYGQILKDQSPEAESASGKGVVFVEVSTVVGQNLPARVELRPNGKTELLQRIELPEGQGEFHTAPGEYDIYIFAYDRGVPLLVNIEPLRVAAGKTVSVFEDVLEGASGGTPLMAFDKDHDLAIDRVELAAGTDPKDAASVPGEAQIPINDAVLNSEAGWYRGDLQAYSKASIGQETVGELVARAEASGLDFLAITDRNTIEAVRDPAFTSRKVALIPALEWGTDDRGYALIYGPRTFPALTESPAELQALMVRVQAQHGVFAIAHPCFPTMAWQWPVTLPNAIQVWCRDWRAVPPVSVDQLRPEFAETQTLEGAAGAKARKRYIYPIARAAASHGLSANGQAQLYHSFMVEEGVRSGIIGGSHSANPAVPLGRPMTYVYAREKSVRGILEGILYGRTYVTAGPEAPRLHVAVDVGHDKSYDASFGDTIPLGAPSLFLVTLWGAKGKRAEVLRNGYPIRSATVPEDPFSWGFEDTPEIFTYYQVRITEPPAREGFGSAEVLAISSPIYADVTRAPAPGGTGSGDGKGWIRIEAEPGAPGDDQWEPPADAEVKELTPNVIID